MARVTAEISIAATSILFRYGVLLQFAEKKLVSSKIFYTRTMLKVANFINEGSFGSVYKSDRGTAIKKCKSSSHHPLLSHEYKLLKKLQSHYFPRPTGLYFEKKALCLEMEYLPLCLFDLVSEKDNFIYKNFLSSLLRIIDDLNRGLNKLHSLDYVHMDIKPENVMIRQLTNDLFDAVIIDLEGSVPIGSNCKFTYSIETASLEVLYLHCRPKSYKAVYSDIPTTYPSHDYWGLGCIAFYICTGADLFLPLHNSHINYPLESAFAVLTGYNFEQIKRDRITNKPSMVTPTRMRQLIDHFKTTDFKKQVAGRLESCQFKGLKPELCKKEDYFIKDKKWSLEVMMCLATMITGCCLPHPHYRWTASDVLEWVHELKKMYLIKME